MLPNSDLNNAKLVANKVHQEISTDFSINGHTLNIGCSIGIATYPNQAKTSEELLNIADIAMYYAKRTNLSYHIHSYEHSCLEGSVSAPPST